MSEGWREFAPYLKELARGPDSLQDLDPETAREATELILRGVATPAQAAGFFLIGRAKGNGAGELAGIARGLASLVRPIEVPEGPPVVAVSGGFDGKLRTTNVGAVSSLVAAAAGGRVVVLAGEDVPPKSGRTNLDALRNLGVGAPQTLAEATASLAEDGLAAVSPRSYLPELDGLRQLRREMVRRTALNVAEKLVSPVAGARMMVGITHRRPFLETMPDALRALGVERALVYQAVEGSDEAPPDGASSLLLVTPRGDKDARVAPEDLGLGRATRADIPWGGEEAEAESLLGALSGEEGPVLDMILYNAALRLWLADEETPLAEHVRRAREAISTGAASAVLDRMRRGAAVRGG
ncbi:hypothetical protein GBA65_12455 [Rubrobacter marinus]|uniref:Anthranilate phosphoribosyltransferase n=1 Tax=Rubrobacter marinus TaxID=2653852 RepID=A0A6G8PYH7_9ACTN|nr:hypothetical protein [Rubrobacter marinus]QIN79197.1 hypothetical protein GBA65_12455 [Rubrobacter marinus]